MNLLLDLSHASMKKIPAGLGYGSFIPDASGGESHSLTKRFAERIGICVDQYIEAMEKVISCANESFLYSYSSIFSFFAL